MPQFPTWILIACGTASLIWLLLYRRLWNSGEEPAPPVPSGNASEGKPPRESPKLSWQAIRKEAPGWIRENWRAIGSALVVIAIAILIWQLSPRSFSRFTTQSGQPGHPLYALSYVRGFMLDLAPHLSWSVAVLAGLASVGLLILAQLRRKPQPAQVVLLIVALGLAALSQLNNLGFYQDSLLVLYLLAALFFSLWILGYQRWAESDLLTQRWPLRFEILMLLIPIAFTFWARFVALPDLPFGIEGDESKWTVEVVASMIDGEYPHSTAYHLSSVPLSFYMQAPFHHILGPSLLSARIAVAFYSVLGSLAFYWLAREITSSSVAWVATMLLGASIFDISASRLANVESFVKLWPVLGLALLAHASRTGKKSSYFFSGITAGLGILTYDTVAPLIPLALILAAYELVRNRVPLAESVRRMSAFLIPMVAALPVTFVYLAGRMQYYDLGSKGWDSDTLASFVSHLGDVLYSMFIRTWSDFLYNRDGPLFNSLLIPWLFAGTMLLVLCWRRGRLLWILLTAFLFFFPVPILTNSPMGRVLYPGLPAAYWIMALGIVASFLTLQRLLGDTFRPALISLAALGLGFLSILNLYIYFNEVHDPDDRRIRRTLYEIVREVSAPDVITVMPYVPKGDDPIEQEGEQMIWFALRTEASSTDDLSPLEFLPLSELLPTLANQPPEIARGELIWDTHSSYARTERNDMLATFLACYPNTELHTGMYYDRFTIPEASLRSPQCRSGVLTLEPQMYVTSAGLPVYVTWALEGSTAADLDLECSTVREDVTWIHAEDLQGQGWEGISRYVVGYDGWGFLSDHQSSQTASINIQLPNERPVYIWVRSLRRVVDEYPGFLQIGTEAYTFSEAASVPLNEWTWERTGPFDPEPGRAELQIFRPFPETQPGYMALFIDTLLLTASASFDPNTMPTWEHALHMDLPLRERATSGDLLLNFDEGQYLCVLTATDGTSLVDHRGNVGLRSNPVEIRILPSN